jgi:hypothetical protein
MPPARPPGVAGQTGSWRGLLPIPTGDAVASPVQPCDEPSGPAPHSDDNATGGRRSGAEPVIVERPRYAKPGTHLNWPQPIPEPGEAPYVVQANGERRPWHGYVLAENGRPVSEDRTKDGTYITAPEWKHRLP